MVGVDAIALAFICFHSAKGFLRGFVSTLFEFGALLVGSWGASTFGPTVTEIGVAAMVPNPLAASLVGFGVTWLAFTASVLIVGKVLNIVAKLPVINSANRLLGLAIGVAKGTLYLIPAVAVLMVLAPSLIADTYVEAFGVPIVEKLMAKFLPPDISVPPLNL